MTTNKSNTHKSTANKRSANAKPTKTQNTSQSADSSWFAFLFRPYNLLFGLVAILFLAWINSSVPSYNWVYNGLLKGGYETCKQIQKEIDRRSQGASPEQRKSIAMDTKYEAKVGVEFMVLKYIRDNTPKDAVILFPPSAVISQKDQNLTLSYELSLKAYPSYFLYPRKVVYEWEKGKNPLFEKVQYVFALHGWGYQYLDYQPAQRNIVDILPIHGNANH
jgi:hypothetical protein